MFEKYNSNKNQTISVVGAGLVGSLAALQLGQLGYQVNLYEYREDIRTAKLVIGRSINLALSIRGRAALKDVGLEDTLLQHGIPMRGRMLHDTKGRKKVVLYDPVNEQCIYSVSRKYLNEVLLNAAEKRSNIQTHFNRKLVNAKLDQGELTFLDTTNKEMITTTADLVIGADGAFSAVRKEMTKYPGFNYSQTYIEHGYLELCIPPTKDNNFAMEKNYLHIWPRGKFMMIALPNEDKSWTVTLFMPFQNFNEIKCSSELLKFFGIYFPDAIDLIGKQRLIQDFFKTKPQHLVQVKCNPYHAYDKCLIIGDAAHAMVPFYGQGMNAGFEDVSLLKALLEVEADVEFKQVLQQFTDKRWQDAHAICDLAMYNYIEMRDLVTKRSFLLRKFVDTILFRLLGDKWMPLYNTVSFSRMPYHKCIENRKRQDETLVKVGLTAGFATVGTLLAIGYLKFLPLLDTSKLTKYFN